MNTNCTISEKSLANLHPESEKKRIENLKIINSNGQRPEAFRKSKMRSLNCFAVEWNRTIWLNCWVILKSLSFALAFMLSTSNPYLISLVVEIKIRHGAMTMTKTHSTVRLLFIMHTNWITTANAYPTGFFTSNGNLHTKNIVWVGEKNHSNSSPKWTKKAYHIDVCGSSKTSAPTSVVK